MVVHQGPYAGTYFYVHDGNGNVMALVSAADGTTAAQYEYSPFGKVLRATGPLAMINPFLFATQYYDWETGLYYYGYRYYDPSTGRWLSRDPLEEDGGVCLYGFNDNDSLNGWDALGEASKGHHIFARAVSEGMSQAVRDFFDQDMNRIFNEYYKTHNGRPMAGITVQKYKAILTEELQKFVGRQEIRNLTLEEAKAFMAHLNTLPRSHPINLYNKAVEKEAYEAMKLALARQAERAAASSLLKAEASGARRLGGKKPAKAIPVVGTVVAIYCIWQDAKVYGTGPAVGNGLVTAIPLVGTGVIGSEVVAGGRWLDVIVGPKEVQPTDIGCQ